MRPNAPPRPSLTIDDQTGNQIIYTYPRTQRAGIMPSVRVLRVAHHMYSGPSLRPSGVQVRRLQYVSGPGQNSEVHDY